MARTDPAAELAKVLDLLSEGSTQRGSVYLADKFNVSPWSLEFYQILFSIVQRLEGIRSILCQLEGFEHLKEDLDEHLDALKEAFTTSGLQNAWSSFGTSHVNAANIRPLKMCSAFLRAHISYPDLSEQEQADILKTANELLTWLREHQLEENDFIRQALIEGLEGFIFRLERLKWLGWGYSLESLKAVVMAYIALEGGFTTPADMPRTSATIKKLGVGLKHVFGIVGISKDVVDRADFALKAYGALMLALQAPAGVAGLLGN